jgi:phosphinothricin acetyltransferase
MKARPAEVRDAEAIARIYNEGIDDRVATFETRHRSPDEVSAWLGDPMHPVVVIQEADGVVAFANSGPTSARACYARNAHFGVYVARASRRLGAGALAVRALVDAAREAGLWKLASGVFTDNRASLSMLGKLGFRTIGVQEAHGVLDGAWRDVALVERIVAPTVVFACENDAGRAQMAATLLARAVDPTRVRILSAGTEPVHPEVVTLLVTMGGREKSPIAPFATREDWPLDDVAARTLDLARRMKDGTGRLEDWKRFLGG